MGITIGSNIAALRAERKLSQTSSSLSETYARLSSGQRINKASDDAAGLSISESLKKDVRVYAQAIRNVNDGQSLLNIADSTVDALANIVVRIRELTQQAANGTFSPGQRQAIDQEAQSLSKEFTRIVKSAKFNSQAIFDGTLSDGLRIQAGFGIDGSIQSTLGRGLGTGTFGARITCGTDTGGMSGHSEALRLGDLNGDGILDMVTAGAAYDEAYDPDQPQATVLLGRGDGTFAPKAVYATEVGDTGGSSCAIALGDLNGDGILDLVTGGTVDSAAYYYSGQVSVRLGRGDGTFGDRTTYATEGASGGYCYAVSLGDLNGDGDLDLVTAGSAGSPHEGQAGVRLGRGDGTFGGLTMYTTMTGDGIGGDVECYAVALGDVNGDGILDMAAAGFAYDDTWEGFVPRAAIRLGRGNGTFGASVSYNTGSYGDEEKAVCLGDVNADGIMDLITAGVTMPGSLWVTEVGVFLGRGNGAFGGAVGTSFSYTLPGGSGDSTTHAVRLGDANGDGITDIAVAGSVSDGSTSQGQVSILLGKGRGLFGPAAAYITAAGGGNSRSKALDLGDVNGDGIADLVTAGYVTNGSKQGQASVLLGCTRDGIAPILPFSLLTVADAKQTMGLLDNKLNALSAQRGTIGAFQSRLQVGANALLASRESFAAAGGRITDADAAQESANLTRTQILQQAGAAVLSQANQQPALALRLLA